MTIGHFDEDHSQELMFADTNVQLVLICSSGYNLQCKPFCDWLTLIEQKCHPSKVSVFSHQLRKCLHLETNVIYGLSRSNIKLRYTWL